MALLLKFRVKAYKDIVELWNVGVSPATLERLADADAFRSMGLDRRRAIWEVSALADRPATLFINQANEGII